MDFFRYAYAIHNCHKHAVTGTVELPKSEVSSYQPFLTEDLRLCAHTAGSVFSSICRRFRCLLQTFLNKFLKIPVLKNFKAIFFAEKYRYMSNLKSYRYRTFRFKMLSHLR
jgi:hypothetical protein